MDKKQAASYWGSPMTLETPKWMIKVKQEDTYGFV